ncbi:MAG: hypothetical protein IJC78_07335 [Clostridia bacterium]|nr:hypothetical protein [Clostridia bacterium]
MKKLLASLVALSMLLTVTMPMAFAEGEPAFPEGTTLTVTTSGANVGFTYPNTALNADGTVVPAHKIEILATEIKNNSVYSAVHKVAEGALTTETVHDLVNTITMKAQRGSFSVNVYPMSTTDETTAVLGTPLTANFTLTEPALPHGAVRYEFEDYVSPANAKAAESIPYASGGKLYASHNGAGWFANYNYLSRTANADLSFDVELPYDCNYTIDIAMHQTADKGNLGVITAMVDGNIISKSTDTATSSLALSGQYPWSYMPLKLFQDKGIALSAGKHTVSLEMTVPTNTVQPHHFIADYIQFTPETEIIADSGDSWIEFENYVGKGITDDGTGKNLTTTNYYPSSVAHAGASFHTDSYSTGDAGYDVLVNVPMYVESSGVYSFEYVTARTGNGTKLYLNQSDLTAYYENTATPFLIGSGGTVISTDVKNPLTSMFPYFNTAHHQAQKFTSAIYLEKGENLLTVEVVCRAANAGGTAATCLDYFKLTPTIDVKTVAAEGESRIELEEYTGCIIYDKWQTDTEHKPVLDEEGNPIVTGTNLIFTGASVQYDDYSIGYASNDRLLNMSEKTGITGPSTLLIPVKVEKDGWYDVDWVVTNSTNNGHLSVVQLQVDGKAILQNNKNVVADGISYLASKYYPTGQFKTRTYLTAGDHLVTMNAAQIATYTNNYYGIKYNADYLAFTPVETTEGVTLDESTKTATASVALPGSFTGKVITACYAGDELVGVAAKDITAEGILTTSASFTATPDTVKVFVWSDLSSVTPLTVNKTFTME